MLETQRRGGTVIETIMVLTIVAVVAAIGGPKLSSALQRRTTAATADQFALTHSLSRSTALRYGRIAQLHIDAPGKRFWIDVDTSANGVGQRATIFYVRDIAAAGLTMSTTRSLLCFDPRGIPSTTGSCEPGDATVIFSAGATADTVVTTVLGKILR
jgi:Tfp pilus assembly protein FimT